MADDDQSRDVLRNKQVTHMYPPSLIQEARVPCERLRLAQEDGTRSWKVVSWNQRAGEKYRFTHLGSLN